MYTVQAVTDRNPQVLMQSVYEGRASKPGTARSRIMNTLSEFDLTRRLTVAFFVTVATCALINACVAVSEHNIQCALHQ